nr:MAG TPA: protein of unknown function DUF282 [Caudoviricetes sp.]
MNPLSISPPYDTTCQPVLSSKIYVLSNDL